MQKWSRIARSPHKNGTPVKEMVMNGIAYIVAFCIPVYYNLFIYLQNAVFLCLPIAFAKYELGNCCTLYRVSLDLPVCQVKVNAIL